MKSEYSRMGKSHQPITAGCEAAVSADRMVFMLCRRAILISTVFPQARINKKYSRAIQPQPCNAHASHAHKIEVYTFEHQTAEPFLQEQAWRRDHAIQQKTYCKTVLNSSWYNKKLRLNSYIIIQGKDKHQNSQSKQICRHNASIQGSQIWYDTGTQLQVTFKSSQHTLDLWHH